MRKRISIIFSLSLIFLLVSISGGFDNNKENFNPSTKDPIPYTLENINNGKLKGGHDTITTEGMLLKKQVHKDDKVFEDFSDKALPHLRIGAHDEDTSKLFNLYLQDPPLGPNGWGDFFQHFYNPETGKGFKGTFGSAPDRAVNYFIEILKKVGCGPNAINNISQNDKKKIYDYFGRILHLLQDMGNPAHTRDDLHVFTKTFEDYVRDHWSEIVNSENFKEEVTPEKYLQGNYDNLPNTYYSVFYPEEFIKALAEISKNYYTDGLGKMTDDQVKANTSRLIPETIKYTAGYINAIYQMMSGGVPNLEGFDCNRPPDPPSPANDHPDDRFDVSDEFYWEKEFGLSELDLTNFILRVGIKKGKVGLWYKKRFMELFIEGRTKYKDASQEIKNAIESEFHALGRKLEERRGQAESDWKGAPDIALFTNGFYKPSISLMLKIGEPVSFQNIDFNPEIVKDHPVLLVPTGGFYGLKDSTTVRALLDEYVKNGGTLVVFTQQHGYDWGLLPTPVDPETGKRKSITGYGYQEDQSCQYNSVFIDTYHPVLSVFSTPTANIGVDGYFTSYPESSTVLLRRVSNGQPAMIMYPYGNGYVIATTMYTDFAFTHNQANQTEINFVQNIISWAKKPASLIEVKPGEMVSLNVDVRNFMDVDSSVVKFTILDPARKIVTEQAQNITIPVGQSITIPVIYASTNTSPLGIYHIDYTLLDAQGNIVQPRAESDSGRFAVSQPSGNIYHPLYQLWVTSPVENVFKGEEVIFTIHIKNNTAQDILAGKIGIGSHEARSEGGRWWVFHEAIEGIDIPAGGQVDIPWTFRINISQSIFFGLFKNADNPNTYLVRGGLAWAEKGIKLIIPSLDVTLKTDKNIYLKEETLVINALLKNNIGYSWQPTLKIYIKDSKGINVFEDEKTYFLIPNGTISLETHFTLPSTLAKGNYLVKCETWYKGRFLSSSYTGFEILQSQILVQPNLSSPFNTGTNLIPFTLSNIGKINVSSGTLDLNLKAPDGSIVYTGNHSFSLSIGESKMLEIPISISSLNFGNYTLIYTQSDETSTGSPTYITIPNSIALSLSLDKSTYRVRETANLKVDLKNIGKFNLENISLNVSVPDINYIDTKTLSLGVSSEAISLEFAIPIPETILPGLNLMEIDVILSSGSRLAKTTSLNIPESALSVSYSGEANPKGGDLINVNVTNSGGVDTGINYVATLTDDGVTIARNTGDDNLQASQTKAFSLQIPLQAVEGKYLLLVEVTDKKTHRRTYLKQNLTISGLKANLTVKTDHDIYLSSENIIVLSEVVNQAYGIENGNLLLQIVNRCGWGMPASYYVFTWDGTTWVSRGTLHYPNVLETQLIDLSSYLPDPTGEYKVRIKHIGEDHAEIDYISLVAGTKVYIPSSAMNLSTNQNILALMSDGDGWSANVLNNEIEVRWTDVPNSANLVLLMRAQEGEVEHSPCHELIYWQGIFPIGQGPNTSVNLNHIINPLYQSGQFYLQGTLVSQTGQVMNKAEYRFHVIDGDIGLRFHTDKNFYREGETIRITGDIVNLGLIQATNVTVRIYDHNWTTLYTETFDISAKESHPISFTITAGSKGIYPLYGMVFQNMSYLTSISEKYEVAVPKLLVTAEVPSIVGNEPFPLNITVNNEGKIPATVQMSVEGGSILDVQTISLAPNETRLIQYNQSISSDATYTIDFTGDLSERIIKMVSYGLGASIQLGGGGSELGVFSEGRVAMPVTLTNTGQLAETLTITYLLNPGTTQQSRTYSLPVGGSITDTLYFDLHEGDYQITASSQKPDAIAHANFSVRKENQVEMTVSLGTQTDGLIPVNVNLANLGYNEINGSVIVSVSPSTGQAVWNGGEPVSQLLPQRSQIITLNINPSAFEPNHYTLQAQLLTNSNQLLAVRSLEFMVRSPQFQIMQMPPYQTFYPGQEATFIFRVRNTGDQEGSFDLRFKSYDLIDSTQREWLKPGEEKTLTFSFILPEDLEEKDYFATYELRDSRIQGAEGLRGQIKYHLAGIKLTVHASLDKPYYTEGETARLSIDIQSSNPIAQSLFARVNYAGHETQQAFTLNGTHVLIFDIPLTQITGEKLFYGVYHEGGRSIHLNSLYIYKVGDVITVTTDKQVYHPGETVIVSISGNVDGTMTLSAPGGYEETFPFSGQITKNFTLPSTMIAGTYFIHAILVASNPGTMTVSHPFDVEGIFVKVLECKNDKGKYASSDLIKTSLNISTNTTMPALLKMWIVDPSGQYISVGEQTIHLSSSENSLINTSSPLVTTISGIHRLVYGIYGSEGLLLCSGGEAFDVGDAILLGLSTNKRDYPTNIEPVIITTSLFGSVGGELQLELDGIVIKRETVLLNGLTTYSTRIQEITPGPHVLKGTLTAGGLKSTKEISFTYALAFMPKPMISASPTYLEFGNINLSSSSTQKITLSSIGNKDLAIGMITLLGTNQEEFSISYDGCSGQTISPSGDCSIDVLFSPTSLGEKSALLSISSNSINFPTLILPLRGRGAVVLTISVNPISSGRVTGEGIDCPGDCTEIISIKGVVLQLTATPTEGNRFVNWSGDIDSLENPVSVNMDDHRNVTANFKINTFNITATAGLGGLINPSGLITLDYGACQTFIITPNLGYHIVDVRVDGISIGPISTYTFENIHSHHTIEVIFGINLYTITAIAGENGTIFPSGTLTAEYGSSKTFTIIPNSGYHIAEVKVDGTSIGPVTTFTFDNITSNHTIEASFDEDLVLTWAKTYGGKGLDLAFTIKQTEDRGYIIGGESWSFGSFSSDAWVIKLDPHGNIQWQKRYGGNLNDVIYSIEQTQDGGYIMAGETNAALPFLGLFWVVKLNANGEIQWQKTYNQGRAHSIQQTFEGGYVATGMNMGRAWVVKLDANGSIQWQKKYGGIRGDVAQTVQQTSEGGYIVAGMMKGEVWVLKLNSAGETQWQKTYGNSCVDANFSIQQTQEGGYILASVSLTFGTGNTDIWILKLNAEGEIEWQKTYGGSGFELAHSIQKTQDGGYMVVGWTDSFGSGNIDAWLLKLNPKGEIEWQKAYGSSGVDLATSINPTQDGGYVVVGATNSFGVGEMDIWLLKVDASGNMLGCPGGLIKTTSSISTMTSATGNLSNETAQTTQVSPKKGNATVKETFIVPGSICGN
jgi:hypothetical protein